MLGASKYCHCARANQLGLLGPDDAAGGPAVGSCPRGAAQKNLTATGKDPAPGPNNKGQKGTGAPYIWAPGPHHGGVRVRGVALRRPLAATFSRCAVTCKRGRGHLVEAVGNQLDLTRRHSVDCRLRENAYSGDASSSLRIDYRPHSPIALSAKQSSFSCTASDPVGSTA